MSLFSGIGGIGLAAEWAGFETILQVEKDPYCRKVLAKHWPNVKRIERIEDVTAESVDRPITLVSGGDPCPIRSRARAYRKTSHPDLSGYFLAVVGHLWPRWVVRENVPASDVIDFETALDVLRYERTIVTSNAYMATGQNRLREFVVGCPTPTAKSRFILFLEQNGGKGSVETKRFEAEGYPCLTTHPWRYDARDGYIWEGGPSLRVADRTERERLSGFPEGWTDGLSWRRMATVTGNAVVPQQVYPILRAIADIELGGER